MSGEFRFSRIPNPMRRCARRVALFTATATFLAAGALAHDNVASARRLAYNRDVRPILSDKCFSCHGPDSAHRQADLRLDRAEDEGQVRGGHSVIEPGKPEESELWQRITSRDESERMPPPDSGKELSAEEIAILEEWIRQGAVYEPHWAYQAFRNHSLPEVSDREWCREPWDRFLMARWDDEQVEHAPEADRRTLARRLYLDLTGLPAPIDDVEAFVADERPDAYERLVDKLLASPHFGERMAVYWLDLVRYADTVGYHGDQEHAASPYRDYVIQAFNDNKPFDQFTREQLAGDLLPNRTEEQWVASCYNRILQTSHEGGVQIKEYLAKYLADRVRNLGSVWLGSTLACAECHNHKYDPFTQQDFYNFGAFFADVEDLMTFRGGDTSPTKREPEIEVLDRPVRWELQEIENRLQEVSTRITSDSESLTEQERNELLAEQKRLEACREVLRRTARRVMVTVSVEPRTIRVLPRGDWMDDSGPIAQPAFPEFLRCSFDRPPRNRLDLADWLTTPDHPLTARVFVNRIWALFFGEGLCPSLDDVGGQGLWPVHPELLDQLAVQFVEDGWDVKLLVRRIVLSSAYRQQSVASAQLQERDPANLWFARQTARRLPAEFIRDSALAVSGLLNRRIGGPPARPYQPEGYYALLNFPKRTYRPDRDANQYRRGVYMHWQRQFLHPMLKAFDAPQREECVAKRPVSNTPLAALTLLNDPTFVEAARVFAERIVRLGGASPGGRVTWAWREALGRSPSEEERAVLVALFQENLARYREQRDAAGRLVRVGLAPVATDLDAVELAAWTQVARAIFNLHEFLQRN
ncbi:MAG: hypothetical protein KatS3mg110_0698 [Pirellulaceae bacterium]|nr:MAG: hypothetical protein KatS3mg110_0698 [Pirellulaceae bacterium]